MTITGAKRKVKRKISKSATSLGRPTIMLTLAAVITTTSKFCDQGSNKAKAKPKATELKIAGKMVPPRRPSPKVTLVKTALPTAKMINITGPSTAASPTIFHKVKAPDQRK